MKGCRKSFQNPSHKIKIALLECELQAFENTRAGVEVNIQSPPWKGVVMLINEFLD